MKKVLLILMGKSGTGKTTITNELQKKYGLLPLPSYTTRPKRPKSDNTDHTYITVGQYHLLKDKVATAFFHGNYYCATAEQIEMYDTYVCDPEGVKELKLNYKGDKTLIVINLLIDGKERIKRMTDRGDTIGSILLRMDNDVDLFAYEEFMADYRIENVSLEETVDKIYQIYLDECEGRGLS